MNASLMLLLIGLGYLVVFGGMSLLRREGFSVRFAVETIAVTLLLIVFNEFTKIRIQPVVFLILLYLVTMRVRLGIDLANSFARRGNYATAERLYALSGKLGADANARQLIRLNQATSRLQQGQAETAVQWLRELLQDGAQQGISRKNEAACHYNLGVAYRRLNREAEATVEFNAAIDISPVSEIARRAAAALKHGREQSSVKPAG
ncbi:MAG TPA: hypothetical protein VHO48_15270 [Anaerolineaceae bacterium]|nr:hypothetical protein [Anaerolineaceae bacterium]